MKIYCLKSLFFAALIMLSFTACGGGYSKVQSAAELPRPEENRKDERGYSHPGSKPAGRPL